MAASDLEELKREWMEKNKVTICPPARNFGASEWYDYFTDNVLGVNPDAAFNPERSERSVKAAQERAKRGRKKKR